MDCALDNQVPGIAGKCGGAGHCTTCHCYVDEAWMDRTGAIGRDEEEMLSYLDNRRQTSRLTCQIRLSKALDGLVVWIV